MAMPNFTELDATLNYIRAHPEEWDQDMWFRQTECGTTMCFAGVTAWRHGWTPVFYYNGEAHAVERDGETRHVRSVARNILGLYYPDDNRRVELLFEPHHCVGDSEVSEPPAETSARIEALIDSWREVA